MPFQRVPNAGQYGVIADLAQPDLPLNAWTDALNMRPLDGSMIQFFGQGEAFPNAAVVPYHVMPVNVGSDRYWLYAGLAKIYCVTSTTGSAVHTNLTRQTAGVDVDYSGAANAWTSTSLSGIPILNPGNTTDPPQQWGLSTGSRFAALSNWPASTYCKALRAYKNQLVALNVTKGTTNYPYMVKWSHPADPGSVPVSWDETDPTHDAGEVDLAEGGDPIIDGLQLGGTFVIYKEQSVWRMDYAGGAFIEQFTKVMGSSGAMNRNCIVEIDGQHLVLTTNDVIVHDGNSAKSVLDKQTRRDLFRILDSTYYTRSFVVKNPYLNEVFICFPQASSTVPDMALVWNYRDNTCTFREIPSLNHAAYGPVGTSLSQTWDSDASPWLSDITTWSQPEYTPDAARVLLAANNQKLYLLDSSATFDGTQISAFCERRGLTLGIPEQLKTITSIRPRIRGQDGFTVNIKVGGADNPQDDPVYTATVPYTIGQSVSCDCFVSARYPAIRFESGTAYQWALDGYDFEWQPGGGW